MIRYNSTIQQLPLILTYYLAVTWWQAQARYPAATLEYWRWLKPAHRIVDSCPTHFPNNSSLLNSCRKCKELHQWDLDHHNLPYLHDRMLQLLFISSHNFVQLLATKLVPWNHFPTYSLNQLFRVNIIVDRCFRNGGNYTCISMIGETNPCFKSMVEVSTMNMCSQLRFKLN